MCPGKETSCLWNLLGNLPTKFKYDRLVRDEGVTNPVRSDDEGQDEDSQKAFEKCLSLENNCAVPQGHKSWSQCCAMQKFQSTTVDITDLIKVTVGILNTE